MGGDGADLELVSAAAIAASLTQVDPPANGHHRERQRHSAQRHPRIRLTEIGERHALMERTVDQCPLNDSGGIHGELIAALADTFCFFSAPLLPAG